MGWKKIIAILCAAAAMVSVVPAGYSEGNEAVYAALPQKAAATPEPTPHVNPYIETDQFRFNAATGTIIQYIGSETEVEIPAEIAGVAVTAIGGWAFAKCLDIEHVTIPESVESIGENAFNDCRSLIDIVILEGVKNIGEGAFSGCDNLKSVSLPRGLESIGAGAFEGCVSLIKMEIPEGITVISDSLFSSCVALTSVSLPDSVTTIEEYAFYSCADLISAEIPKNVNYVGEYAFSQCDSLRSIGIPEGLNSISEGMFSQCERLKDVYYGGTPEQWGKIDIADSNEYFTKAAVHYNEPMPLPHIRTDEYLFDPNTGTIETYTGNDSVIKIPSEIEGIAVKAIGDKAFIYNEMTEVIIPDSVVSIGESAFESCRGITNMVIPDSVVSIGEDAFYGCQYLKDVKLPNGLTSISDGVFWGCRSLKGVTIPEGVASIGAYAFQSCEDLTDITIPNNVVSIGSSAFGRCIGLDSITVPDSVTFIGDGAFRWVKRVNLSGENPSYCLVDGMMYSKDKTKLFYCPPDFSEKEYHIPDSVTALGAGAFCGCIQLTKVTIPDAIIEIPDNAFDDCSSLISIDIPEGVTSIGRYAFGSCSSLTSITIPEGVEVISFGAFWNCSGLTSVSIPKSVYSIEKDAFRYCDSLTDVYYNGTQEEWEWVYADENNEPLLNAAIHFKDEPTPTPTPHAPVWRLSAAVSAGMLGTSVTNMSDETVTGTIIKVYYDESDKIIDVNSYPLTLKPNDNLMADEPISGGKYVKIFAWNTALGMTPLSSDVTVNLR